MPIESATYLDDLNPLYPDGADEKSEGDDHLRLLKSVLQATFPNIAGAVTPDEAELNVLTGAATPTDGKVVILTTSGGDVALPAVSGALLTDLPVRHIESVLCPHRNLVGQYDSATQVTYTADELLLYAFDGSTVQQRLTAFNKSASITATGAGGRDTGVEAISTWYYIWAIAKAAGADPALMFSTASSISSLTMPTDYIYAGLLGAVRNDASGNFVDFRQRNRSVAISVVGVLTNGSSTGGAAVNLAAAVPTLATEISGYWALTNTSSGLPSATLRSISGSNVGIVTVQANYSSGSAERGQFSLLLVTAQTMYYEVNLSSTDLDLNISGFRFL